jgi:hypothetical protein
MKRYPRQAVTRKELSDLERLARDEEAQFFVRNPHLVAPYRDRLVAIALCQGAALQFVGRGQGVDDFDVHFFYAQNPDKPRMARTIKHRMTPVGDFPWVHVDFVRTILPVRFCAVNWDWDQNPTRVLQAYLTSKPTPRAGYLARKAVVGLFPPAIFGQVIWG